LDTRKIVLVCGDRDRRAYIGWTVQLAGQGKRVKSVLNLEVVVGVQIKPQTLYPGNQHPKLAHPSLKTSKPGFSPGLLMWQWSTPGS
jgi:hypothetical protein